jgi:hypothetical protein
VEALTPSSSASSARSQRLLVLLFCGFLAAPALDMLVRPARARGPEIEGRAATPFPEWRAALRERSNYPRRFDQAFADALGLRDVLLRWHHWARFELLNIAPAPVLLGKQRWMFYTFEHSLENWRGLYPMDEPLLKAWQGVIESRRDCARAHGAEYLFVIGPNKESIYPDFLPEGFEPLGPTRLDQLRAWMQAHSDIAPVDLRPRLRAARSLDTPEHHLYYEEGSHWQGLGCVAAADEIFKRLTPKFPAIGKVPETPWRIVSGWPAETWRPKMYLTVPRTLLRDDPFVPEDTRRAVHLGDDWLAKVQRFEQRVPAPELPSVLMFHDSFGTGVHKLLAERFSRLTAVAAPGIDVKMLEEEKPALVIDLYVERVLTTILPEAPRK